MYKRYVEKIDIYLVKSFKIWAFFWNMKTKVILQLLLSECPVDIAQGID